MKSRAWAVIAAALVVVLWPGLGQARDGGGWHGGGGGWHGHPGGAGYHYGGGGHSYGGGHYKGGTSYSFWFGPGVWWAPYWAPGYVAPYYTYYPFPYPVPYPPGSNTTVIVQPPVYVQRPPATPAPPEEGFWYWCQSRGGYYPDVPSCPEGWVKVAPRAE
jgi:hypothetical protein